MNERYFNVHGPQGQVGTYEFKLLAEERVLRTGRGYVARPSSMDEEAFLTEIREEQPHDLGAICFGDEDPARERRLHIARILEAKFADQK